jgi:tRNA pseudouridine38-40 synthase
MARYQVILAYDGTDFRGFQIQAEDRTVQGVVQEALISLGWQGRTILAAGRTDTGVHASGQVIAFDLEWKHPIENLLRALNARLPADVAALDIKPVSPEFHPRYSASSRIYRYSVYCQPVRDPLRERLAWRVWPAVDLDAMQAAAQMLVGKYDFSAFGSPLKAGGSTIRRVMDASWKTVPGLWEDPLLVFEIEADAFLYHMVRRVVYYMVAVGRGEADLVTLRSRLLHPEPVQGLAPAHGLVLSEVLYRKPENASYELDQYSQDEINGC